MKVLGCRYCGGKFYFISSRIIDNILQHKKYFWDYVYEDNIVGYVVEKYTDAKFKSYELNSIFKYIS